MVPEAGIEPARPFGQQILSPTTKYVRLLSSEVLPKI